MPWEKQNCGAHQDNKNDANLSEGVLSHEPLHHPDDGPALAVGDCVEDGGDLLGRVHVHHDGVGPEGGVELQDAVQVAAEEHGGSVPLALEATHALVLQVGGEALVEPGTEMNSSFPHL